MKVRKPLPKSPQAWLNEIADAYIEAREAIPFGRFVGQVITERDLYHMAPAVCLKFRGLKKAEKLLKKATDAALSTYVASEDLSGELLRIPQVAFALCYLAAHFGLDLIREDVVDSVMDYVEREKEVLIDKTS